MEKSFRKKRLKKKFTSKTDITNMKTRYDGALKNDPVTASAKV